MAHVVLVRAMEVMEINRAIFNKMITDLVKFSTFNERTCKSVKRKMDYFIRPYDLGEERDYIKLICNSKMDYFNIEAVDLVMHYIERMIEIERRCKDCIDMIKNVIFENKSFPVNRINPFGTIYKNLSEIESELKGMPGNLQINLERTFGLFEGHERNMLEQLEKTCQIRETGDHLNGSKSPTGKVTISSESFLNPSKMSGVFRNDLETTVISKIPPKRTNGPTGRTSRVIPNGFETSTETSRVHPIKTSGIYLKNFAGKALEAHSAGAMCSRGQATGDPNITTGETSGLQNKNSKILQEGASGVQREGHMVPLEESSGIHSKGTKSPKHLYERNLEDSKISVREVSVQCNIPETPVRQASGVQSDVLWSLTGESSVHHESFKTLNGKATIPLANPKKPSEKMSGGKVSRINLEKSKDPTAETSGVGFKGLENSTVKASRVNLEDTKRHRGRTIGVVNESTKTNVGKTGIQSKICETLTREAPGVHHEEPNVYAKKASDIHPVGFNTSTNISVAHHEHTKLAGEAPRVYSEVLKTPIKKASDVDHTTKMRVKRTRFTERTLTMLQNPKTPIKARTIQNRNIRPLVRETSEVQECPKTSSGKASGIQVDNYTSRTGDQSRVQLASSKPLTEEESELQREDVKIIVEESGVKREISKQHTRELSGVKCNIPETPIRQASGVQSDIIWSLTGESSVHHESFKTLNEKATIPSASPKKPSEKTSGGIVPRINLEKSKDPTAKTSGVGFKGLENSTAKASRVNLEDTKRHRGRAIGVVNESTKTNVGRTGVQSKICETLTREAPGVHHEEPNVYAKKASDIHPVGFNTSTNISVAHHEHKKLAGEAPRVYSEVLKTPIKKASDVDHTTKMRVKRTTRFTERTLTMLQNPKIPIKARTIQNRNIRPLVRETSEVQECPKTPSGKTSGIQVENYTSRTGDRSRVQLESFEPLAEDESELEYEDLKTLVGEESGVKREIRRQTRELSVQCNLSTTPIGETSGHKFEGLNTRTGEVSTVRLEICNTQTEETSDHQTEGPKVPTEVSGDQAEDPNISIAESAHQAEAPNIPIAGSAHQAQGPNVPMEEASEARPELPNNPTEW